MIEFNYNLPFTQDFKLAWEQWLEYRKQARYKKYTEIGAKKMFTSLKKMSNDNEDIAILMIERAMENNWQGFLFKLPENGHTNFKSSNKPGTSEARINTASQW